MQGNMQGAVYVGWEYREQQDVTLALQQHIILLPIIMAGMDFYNSILELSKAIFLSPWDYVGLQGGMGLNPNLIHQVITFPWPQMGTEVNTYPFSADDEY